MWNVREKRRKRVFVGKPEDWRPLGRHRNSVEYNIKLDLSVIGWKWA